MNENLELGGAGELISNYRESSDEELRKLELVVGTELLEYLKVNGLRVFIHKTRRDVLARDTNAGFDARTRMGFVEAIT